MRTTPLRHIKRSPTPTSAQAANTVQTAGSISTSQIPPKQVEEGVPHNALESRHFEQTTSGGATESSSNSAQEKSISSSATTESERSTALQSADLDAVNRRATVLPYEERPRIKLYMEQGVVAPLGRVVLFSMQFSSCSPVVIYNATTKMCGLYHFPAARKLTKQGELTNVGDTLSRICKAVQPTIIYLYDGWDMAPDSDTPQWQRVSNVPALAKFFEEICPGIEIVKDGEPRTTVVVSLGESGDIELLFKQTRTKWIDLQSKKVKLPEFCEAFGLKVADPIWL